MMLRLSLCTFPRLEAIDGNKMIGEAAELTEENEGEVRVVEKNRKLCVVHLQKLKNIDIDYTVVYVCLESL